MSTRWSTHLLLFTICVSSVEMRAKLNVNSVRAAADIPIATRSRNLLSLVTTLYCGSAVRMWSNLLSLSARHERLISATSSTCVRNGSGHFLMYLWYSLKMSLE
jgi:hypothetical protein